VPDLPECDSPYYLSGTKYLSGINGFKWHVPLKYFVPLKFFKWHNIYVA